MNRRAFLHAALALPALGAAHRFVGKPAMALNPNKLGASTACLPGRSIEAAIAEIRQMGFSTIEMITYTGASHSLGSIPGFNYHRATEKERRRVYDATRPFAHISAHLPFLDIHPFSWNEDVREFSLDLIRKGLDGLAFLEGELAVMHVGGPGGGRSYQDIWPLLIDTFRSLGDYAGARGLRIGIETMQPTSVAEFTRLIKEIDHPHIGATIDTGHIRGADDIGLPRERRHSEEGTARFNDVLDAVVEELGEKALHVHLTDVRPADWKDHQEVGSGIIDFTRFFKALQRVGYDNLMTFELEEPESAKALKSSKEYVEKLIAV